MLRCSLKLIVQLVPFLHLDLLEARLAPLAVGPRDGRLVHLVDGDNDFRDTQRLGELCVLSRLAAPLEACLKLGLHIFIEAVSFRQRCMPLAILRGSAGGGKNQPAAATAQFVHD
jgi:hypothetical protein